jgi:hypothetical protein
VPLEGPAIFVSHGGEAFPNLIVVLQGYGVKAELVGDTFINKQGVTSSTFKAIPDFPFTTAEVTLPEGPYSALAANGNLCEETSKLKMPTEWVAQNGAAVYKSTPISVTGCAPSIYVTKHTVKGHTATIQVKVPSAGKLTATGKGLSKASKKAAGATVLTVKLSLTKAQAAFVEKFRKTHKGRKLIAKVNLQFTPTHGAHLKTTTTVQIS